MKGLCSPEGDLRIDYGLSGTSLMDSGAYAVFAKRQIFRKEPAECVEVCSYFLNLLHQMALGSMLTSRPLTGHTTPTSRRRQKDRSSLQSHVEISQRRSWINLGRYGYSFPWQMAALRDTDILGQASRSCLSRRNSFQHARAHGSEDRDILGLHPTYDLASNRHHRKSHGQR